MIMENEDTGWYVNLVRTGNKKVGFPKFNFKNIKSTGKILIGVFVLVAASIAAFYTTRPKDVIVPKAEDIRPNEKAREKADFVSIYPLDIKSPVVNLAVSGQSVLGNGINFIRVILVTKDNKEYLVYENYTQIADSLTSNVVNTCEETCVLPSVLPNHLRIEGNIGSSFNITGVTSLDSYKGKNLRAQGFYLDSEFKANKKEKDKEKLEKIKRNINEKKLRWTAGETELSNMTYAEKRKIFNLEPTDHLPNIQGIEFYKEGIFEINRPKETDLKIDVSTSYPAEFDYRNFHGENWITPMRQKQIRCGSCAAFGVVGAYESYLNLYYNQHFNLDLSEQNIISCVSAGCSGVDSDNVVGYMSSIGVVDEGCYPYADIDYDSSPVSALCDSKCPDWQSRVTKSSGFGFHLFCVRNYVCDLFNGETWTGYTDERYINWIKKGLTTYGPMPAKTINGTYMMSLIGWKTDPIDNGVIWIYKNRWTTTDFYVELKQFDPTMFNRSVDPPVPYAYDTYPYYISEVNGFKSPGSVMYNPNDPLTITPTISCTDKDADGFCNWGLSSTKPVQGCPLSCSKSAQKDCNDSVPNGMVFDSYFNCTVPGDTKVGPTSTPISTSNY